mmetsp:Transcript_39833/g.35546  ORF Transcript_39833/g.35546 Transcript_39833/m.35546 type:complete len:162 (+) Transcript_39833:268-753(+)
MVLGLIFWVIWFLIKKRSFSKDGFCNKMIATFIIVGFNQQPGIITDNLKSFQCQNLYRNDTPERYLKEDYDILCFEGEHLSWALGFYLPLILFWMIILPVALIIILTRHRKKLANKDIKEKYSFLFRGFKLKYYFWEFIILTRKYLLMLIAVFGQFHSSAV